VQSALARRAYTLTQSGAYPYLVLLPNEVDGSKNGLDDFVVRHGIEALRVLARTAQLTPFKLEDEQSGGEKKKKAVLELEEPDITLRIYIRTVLESGINTVSKVNKLIPSLPHPIFSTNHQCSISLVCCFLGRLSKYAWRIGGKIPDFTSAAATISSIAWQRWKLALSSTMTSPDCNWG
jgi:hypothetical protein